MAHLKVINRGLTFYLILMIASFPVFINYRMAYVIYLFAFVINIKHIINGIPDYIKSPLPVVFFFCWVYGVILGLMNGSGLDSVTNFFGLSLLLTTYLLIWRRFSIQDITGLVIYAGIFQAIFQLSQIFFISDLDIVGFFIRETIYGVSDFRLQYNVGVVFTIAAFNLLTLLKENFFNVPSLKFLVRYRWLTCFVLILGIFVTGSKGYFAAFAITLFIRLLFYKYSNIKLLLMIIFTIALIWFFSGTYFADLITVSFSSDELSNAIRDEQVNIIKSEWTFFGKGLGTPLLSGYQRDSPYGLELTYHSIIHKFGYIVGGLLISCLLFLYFKSIVRFLKNSNVSDAVAFSLMACLIPAYGNPSLFSPYSVMAICIAMYCLKIRTYMKKPLLNIT
jgi:hypothetical protein